MDELIVGAIGLITTVTSAWASWFFTRKKYSAEVDNSIIDGMQDSLKFYTSLSDDNKTRLNEMIERSSKIEEENKILREENKTLRERQEELEHKLNLLKAKVDELLSLQNTKSNIKPYKKETKKKVKTKKVKE